MVSRKRVSHFIQPLSLFLNTSKIIEMQEKDNVCSKNYTTENWITVIKKEEFPKVVVPIPLRGKNVRSSSWKFWSLDIQKIYNNTERSLCVCVLCSEGTDMCRATNAPQNPILDFLIIFMRFLIIPIAITFRLFYF